MTHRSPTRRHRSLDSLVSWSAALLDSGQRQTFTEFSVFAGAVTARDAAAVMAPDGAASAIGDLAALAERSLLVADVEGSATRYRMLATLRAVAGRWLDESGVADDVRRRHAGHFASEMGIVDRQLRTTAEAAGRRRLDAIVDEVRVAHQWARRHDPALASTMSGTLHLAAYSTFWNEPVEWSRALLTEHPGAGSAEFEGARIVLAGAAASRGDLGAARAIASGIARSADPQMRAMALEVLTDVSIYAGELDAVEALARALDDVGQSIDDQHAVAIAAVNSALAAVFDDRPAAALQRIDQLDVTRLAPSDVAWVDYTRGEALGAAGDDGARAAFGDAIAGGRSIGNPFVTSVAQVSLAAEHARAGAVPESLGAYADCLRDYARHGNYVHAVTTLRNLVDVLVTVGDDRGAAILAAATSGEGVRPSYGAETARMTAVLAGVAERSGTDQFAAWSAEGRNLDVPMAVRTASILIEHHRS